MIADNRYVTDKCPRCHGKRKTTDEGNPKVPVKCWLCKGRGIVRWLVGM